MNVKNSIILLAITWMVLSAIVLVIITLNTAYAQVDENQEDQKYAKLTLEIPPIMIVGQEYEGHILYKETTSSGTLVQIRSSNPTAIKLPESVFLSPEKNHGIIKIIPEKEGEYKIFVASGGISTEDNTTIVSPQREANKVKIIIPANSTTATSFQGMIFVVDANGSPVKTNQDISVIINTKGGIQSVPDIIIRNGTFSSIINLEILGTGTIFASAANLNPDEIEIIKEKEDIQIELGIAPNIVLENSEAFYYVSLTKKGMPFIPNYVLDVTLSSSDSAKGRFTINPPSIQ